MGGGGRGPAPGSSAPGQGGQRPIFLSGRVVLDGGLPPPETVTIERVCNGKSRPETYTDSKGHFSFQIGQQNAATIDASLGGVASAPPGAMRRNAALDDGSTVQVSSNGTVNLSNCELRAVLPGYGAQPVDLGRRSIFDNPDVGTLILHRLDHGQATAVSMTTFEAPKDARKHWEKAQKLVHQKDPNWQEAAKDLERAVQEYPKFAAAWCLLGRARLALSNDEGARSAFEKSVAADARYAKPYMELVLLDVRTQRWESAADTSNVLIQLNPDYTQAYFLNSVANFNLGKWDLAVKSARLTLKGDGRKSFPEAFRLLGTALAREGDFPSAARELRNFLDLASASPEAGEIRRQLTEWENLGVIEKTGAGTQQAASGATPLKNAQAK
jgi:Flp pilus assembly protein TadD